MKALSGELRLPLASGLLLALSFPPLHLVLPPFLALAPLAVHLDRMGGTEGRRLSRSDVSVHRRAFRAGLTAGGLAWALLLAWIPPALFAWSWLAVPLYGVAVAVLAGLTGAVAAAVGVLRHRAGLPMALALPLGWTAGEWLREHLPGSLAFPWLGLGTSLTGRPEWIGIAEIVGGRGVTFWLATVAGLLAAAWRRWELHPAAAAVERGLPRGAARPDATGRGRARRGAGAPPSGAAAFLVGALALAVGIPTWGEHRAARLETRDVARVAVVQPGVTRRTHPEPRAMGRAVDEALDRLVPGLVGSGADLVVLPEALLPDTLGRPGGEEAVAMLAELARRTEAPVLAGMLVAEGEVVHNSVVLVDPEGRRPWRWDKRHLVPVVERLPLPPLPGVGEGFAGYAPGRAGSVARIRSARERGLRSAEPGPTVGAFVCYESAFPGVSRALSRAGADLLVNVTNDGWFGRAGLRTHALWQHPAHLVMRAVETRTGVARAASTGFSFFVDPVGRIGGRTSLFEEAISVATVTSGPGPTAFVRRGDLVGGMSMALTLALLAFAWLRRGRHIGGFAG